MFDAKALLERLVTADAGPLSDGPTAERLPVPTAGPAVDWRAELTDAERGLFPADVQPTADGMRAVLAVRAAFDAEIVAVSPGPTAAELPAAWREWYDERAAIREFDGGQAREHAEAEALAETVRAMRAAGDWPPRAIIKKGS